MTERKGNAGWGATPSTAPVADESLITRARNEGLELGEPLSKLFMQPSEKAKMFLQGLSPRARAALENAARTTK